MTSACPVCKQPVQDGGLNHACPKYRQPSPDWDRAVRETRALRESSERDKAAEAYARDRSGSVSDYEAIAGAWLNGYESCHARASGEIERLKSDTPAMCAYCSFELPKGAKLSELQKHINRCEHHPLVKEIDRLDIANTKLRNQLAASQVREQGLRRALEQNQFALQCMIIKWNGAVPGLTDQQVWDGAIAARDATRELLAAHGGGEKDE